MGIRETLNQNPGLTTGVTAGIVIIALVFIIWSNFSGGGSASSGSVSKLYYSDDDGKTFYADDVKNIPPYDHNGKQAVRAHVYKCKDGKLFVGYLEELSADYRAKLEKAKSTPGGTGAVMEDAMIGGMEYKKPGAGNKWIRQMTPDAQKVIDVSCPDGSKDTLEQVIP